MFKHCVIVFFVSMVPLIELRGAIPYGVAFDLPLWLTYLIAIAGNMLPVPIIYFFARKVLVWGRDKRHIGKFFTFCLEKGEKAGRKLQAKAGRGLYWALLLFVGIPLPGTRCLDRHSGRQPARYGFQKKHPRLRRRRPPGRCHHGRLEPVGRQCFRRVNLSCNRRPFTV